MWTINKRVEDFKETNLKLFTIANIRPKFDGFSIKPSFVGRSKDKFGSSQPTIISDPISTLEPISNGFLIELDGNWYIESESISRVFQIRKIVLDSFIWLNGKTYVFLSNILETEAYRYEESNLTSTNIELGFYEDVVEEILIGGTSFPFLQTDGFVSLLLESVSLGCRPRVGNQLKIKLTKTLDLTTYKKVAVFDKADLEVTTVTAYSYKNVFYYLNNNLEKNTLINLDNKKFLTIT